jgi:hypothetical protein
MNGLVIFIGESFRLGNQNSRNRGDEKSFDGQMQASNSHIDFISKIIDKYELNSVSVYISSYNTKYNADLLKIYEKYLIGTTFYDNVIGLNNLFQNSVKKIKNIENYDFVLYLRIDLFLKPYFTEIFNPKSNMILYPTICWIMWNKVYNHPRVNDTILFIPKKYYKYINNIIIDHNSWYELMQTTDLTYDDMDTMINTYHDSDSFKDFNPLYYIVNREESKIFHSDGHIFNKNQF